MSGTSLPGNTPIHFAGVQFYEHQTAEKGTDLIANDHVQTTRLDLGIAERCALWRLSPLNQRQKTPKGKRVHAPYVIYITVRIKMPYIICLVCMKRWERIYCISESVLCETAAALQEKLQSVLWKPSCYFLTRTDPFLHPISTAFSIQSQPSPRSPDFCCMHLRGVFFKTTTYNKNNNKKATLMTETPNQHIPKSWKAGII